ncbi:MAG TPA: hypothetical protein VFO60_09780 [Candidatus Dormibacteraeota bacterium]|nr:hypothetical protein [Candidatus Dormibacteraeota bacterium]
MPRRRRRAAGEPSPPATTDVGAAVDAQAPGEAAGTAAEAAAEETPPGAEAAHGDGAPGSGEGPDGAAGDAGDDAAGGDADGDGDDGVGEDADEEAAPELTVRITRASGRRRRRPHLDPLGGRGGPGLVRDAGRRGLLVLPPGAGSAATPASRFETAAAQPPDRGAGTGDAVFLEELATAPITGMGRVPYSSNAVFVVELDAPDPRGDGRIHAVYKPSAGERPLWDFPRGTLHLREVATYLVDSALGYGLVPPTVLRDGPHGPGSMQLLVDATGAQIDGRRRRALEPAILRMAVLDVLVNNADRKGAHLMVDRGGRLWGIDHGLTFLPYPRQRTVLLQLGGAEIPRRAAAAIAALRDDAERRAELVDHLGLLLEREEVAAFAARLDELADDPVYPELDLWDGRPFEWW